MTGVAGRRHHEGLHRFFSRGSWDPDRSATGSSSGFASWRARGRCASRSTTLSRRRRGRTSSASAATSTPCAPPSASASSLSAIAGSCWPCWSACRSRRAPGRCPCCSGSIATRRSARRTARRTARRPSWRATCSTCSAGGSPTGDRAGRRLGLLQRHRHARPARALVLFGAMRPDAVLTALPPPQTGRHGRRPRKRGALLRKPEEIARDERMPVADVRGHPLRAQARRPLQDALRAVVSRLRHAARCASSSSRRPGARSRSASSSAPTLRSTCAPSLETYAGRWGIEVFFREAKQLLGFADSPARKEAAVLRVAPFVGLLYSTLVVWFAEGASTSTLAAPPVRPWYPHKRDSASPTSFAPARNAPCDCRRSCSVP